MKKLYLLTIIFIILIIAGCATPSGIIPVAPKTDPDIDQCFIMVNAGQYQDALPVCMGAVQNNPDSFIAHSSYAGALKGTGQIDLAEIEYRKALMIDPESILTRMNLAGMLRANGDSAKAILEFKEVRTLRADYLDVYTELAVTYKDMNNVNGAVESYKQAIVLEPANEALYMKLAEVLEMGKRYKEARQVLEDASVSLGSLNIQFAYASMLQSHKKYNQAARQYGKIIKTDPNFNNVRYNQAVCYYRAGDTGRAEKVMTRFIKDNPRSSTGQMLLGQLAYDRSNYSEAENAFRKAIDLDKNNGAAWVLLGNTLRQRGDKDGAKKAYRQALRINPRDATAKKNLKRLY
ncbi:tetratricopeptide repeat protein [bacterium]|nr:tetratricopeptide repeat protein [bacterium]